MNEIRVVTDEGTREACYDKGEGSIRFTEKFTEQSELFQADVINDWLYSLKRYFEDLDPIGTLEKIECKPSPEQNT